MHCVADEYNEINFTLSFYYYYKSLFGPWSFPDKRNNDPKKLRMSLTTLAQMCTQSAVDRRHACNKVRSNAGNAHSPKCTFRGEEARGEGTSLTAFRSNSEYLILTS